VGYAVKFPRPVRSHSIKMHALTIPNTRMLLQICHYHPVLEKFRQALSAKSSPVHFFWAASISRLAVLRPPRAVRRMRTPSQKKVSARSNKRRFARRRRLIKKTPSTPTPRLNPRLQGQAPSARQSLLQPEKSEFFLSRTMSVSPTTPNNPCSIFAKAPTTLEPR